jgi:plastocyanin
MKPHHPVPFASLLLASLIPVGIAQAETIEVGQKDKSFTVDKVEIKVGDTIKFANNDPIFHNVFSLSDAKMFDLGSYPQGESKEVVFDQPGEVDVECAIHPNMQLKVIVK